MKEWQLIDLKYVVRIAKSCLRQFVMDENSLQTVIPRSGHGDAIKSRKLKQGVPYFRHTITAPFAFVSVNLITVNIEITELGDQR